MSIARDLLQTERFERFIDMFEMNVEGAKAVNLLFGKFSADLEFLFGVLGKAPLAFPSFHRRALDRFVRGFALGAGARKREQDRLAVIQTFR